MQESVDAFTHLIPQMMLLHVSKCFEPTPVSVRVLGRRCVQKIFRQIEAQGLLDISRTVCDKRSIVVL